MGLTGRRGRITPVSEGRALPRSPSLPLHQRRTIARRRTVVGRVICHCVVHRWSSDPLKRGLAAPCVRGAQPLCRAWFSIRTGGRKTALATFTRGTCCDDATVEAVLDSSMFVLIWPFSGELMRWVVVCASPVPKIPVHDVAPDCQSRKCGPISAPSRQRRVGPVLQSFRRIRSVGHGRAWSMTNRLRLGQAALVTGRPAPGGGGSGRRAESGAMQQRGPGPLAVVCLPPMTGASGVIRPAAAQSCRGAESVHRPIPGRLLAPLPGFRGSIPVSGASGEAPAPPQPDAGAPRDTEEPAQRLQDAGRSGARVSLG